MINIFKFEGERGSKKLNYESVGVEWVVILRMILIRRMTMLERLIMM